MEENYIHIYTSYLSQVYQDKKLKFKEVYKLLQEFEQVCDTIHDRKNLIDFINTQVVAFPQLELLKQRLMDSTYVFPEPPVDAD